MLRVLARSGARAVRLGCSAVPAARPFHASAMSLEALQIDVPSLGDSISEATIIEWTVNVGESVAEDDVLVILETDKVRGPLVTPSTSYIHGWATWSIAGRSLALLRRKLGAYSLALHD